MSIPQSMAERPTDNRKKRKGVPYWLAVFFFFVFPCVMVSLPGVPIYLGRMVAVSSFTFFGTLAIFWFGISPTIKMIRGGPSRPKVELGIRIAVVAFGISFFAYDAWPLASDLLHLAAGEKPAKFTSTVIYRTSGFGGLLLGERSVRFARDGISYYLFYSWTDHLSVGHSYEFTVLPRSRMILDFRESLSSAGDRISSMTTPK